MDCKEFVTRKSEPLVLVKYRLECLRRIKESGFKMNNHWASRALLDYRANGLNAPSGVRISPWLSNNKFAQQFEHYTNSLISI